MLPRSFSRRAAALLAVLALGAVGLAVPVAADTAHHAAAAAGKDPRKSRGLFVDPKMPAYQAGGVYRQKLGSRAQALWLGPEYYPTDQVRDVVRAYTSRALAVRKTPILAVYGIPDRDCGMYSSGGLPGADEYKAWVRQIARGVKDQDVLLILEPDAVPFYGDPRCRNAGDRLGLLRYASRVLSNAGAWVYLDAGHSDWTPYDDRAALLKKAGIGYDRGFSTNVANYRTNADEKAYAGDLLADLRKLDVRGVHYVIDTSRNGAANPVDGDVTNPTWARIGKPPRLVFDGAFDGNLWVKHPGESDGQVNGGGPSGQWCDMLADRLIDGTSTRSSCP
ncbi:glycoside hydrolase family 6 protein [Nocardioides sp.]|uniref:glycoside hydrolase family 6 protein n=1 Tax=Nocardioides sp. TaxID=35761 RepID=UPI003783C3A7